MNNKEVAKTYTENSILIKVLRDIKSDYFGEVILKFENGKLVHMKKTESIKVK